ncbi:MAG: hypothetical protein ACFFB3_15630, partial [Candidatus Hodarchaeota archaeon]
GLDLEAKIDILLGRRLLQTFQDHRRETLRVYLRMAFTMLISLGGLIWNYNEEIIDFTKDYDLRTFVSTVFSLILWIL